MSGSRKGGSDREQRIVVIATVAIFGAMGLWGLTRGGSQPGASRSPVSPITIRPTPSDGSVPTPDGQPGTPQRPLDLLNEPTGAMLFLARDDNTVLLLSVDTPVEVAFANTLAPAETDRRMVRVGETLIYQAATGRTYAIPVGATPQGSATPLTVEAPTDLGASFTFVPSAAPNRVWLVILSRGSPTSEVVALREVTLDGRTTAEVADPYGGRVPLAAVDAGLVYREPSGELVVWDPVDRVGAQYLSGPHLLGAQGPLLAWAEEPRAAVLVLDSATGEIRAILGPIQAVAFSGVEGAFSPDGRFLAVSVELPGEIPPRGAWVPRSAIALVELDRLTATVVPGSEVDAAAVDMTWAASGEWLFFGLGPSSPWPIGAYRIGSDRAVAVALQPGPFTQMVAV